MKSTGIIRKLDELGRIVIPKEIRKKLGIKPSDEIDIFIQNGDNIVLKKHFPMNKLLSVVKDLSKIISEITKTECVIIDTDSIISANGKNVNKLINKKISDEILDVLVNRKIYDSNKNGIINLFKDSKLICKSQIVYPIISDSEYLGAVILIDINRNIILEDYIDILRLVTYMISSQI